MKKIIKVLFFLIIIITIFTITYYYKNPKIAVLCYHNLASKEEKRNFPDEQDWTIDIENFKQHLDYLKKHNYKTLTLEEFTQWKLGEISLPFKSVLITFDDGFLSNYQYAFPLLKEYNMNATVFIVGSFIENSSETEWNGNLKTYMSKSLLENVKKEYPNITISSHSYNLHYQGTINQDIDILEQDLTNFNNLIPENDVLCYPFGQYNKNIETALQNKNYKIAFRYGPNRKDYKKASKNDNNYEIPRLNMSHGMSIPKFALRLYF